MKWTPLVVGLSALAAAPSLWAQGQIGTIGKANPELYEIRDAKDEKKIFFSPSTYKGRVLVIYFWRVSSAECASIWPELIALDQKLKSKGVRFISMAPDTTERVDGFFRDKQIEPFSGNVRYFGSGVRFVQQAFGALAHPEVVIMDPYGRLAWRGHPSDRLEQRILEVAESTQPLGANAKALSQLLRKAEKFVEQSEFGKAYTCVRRVARATDEDQSEHGAAQSIMDKLEEGAAEWLKKASEHERAGELDKAAYIVAELSVRFASETRMNNTGFAPGGGGSAGGGQVSPEGGGRRGGGGGDSSGGGDAGSGQGGSDRGDKVARDADLEIGRMNGDRKLKQLIRTAVDSARAQLLIEEAQLLEDLGQFGLALETYDHVSEKFKENDAAKASKSAAERLRKDSKAQNAVQKYYDTDHARRLLDLGERFTRLNLNEQARQQYESIMKSYPKLPEAKVAKERLEKLPKGGAGEEAAADKADGKRTAVKP